MGPVPGFRPGVSAFTKGIPDNIPWTCLVASVSLGQDLYQVSAHRMWDSLRACHNRGSSGQVFTCAYTVTQMLTHPPLTEFQSFTSSVAQTVSGALTPLGPGMTMSPVTGLPRALWAIFPGQTCLSPHRILDRILSSPLLVVRGLVWGTAAVGALHFNFRLSIPVPPAVVDLCLRSQHRFRLV